MKAKMTLEKLRGMSFKARCKFFDKATPEEIEALTEPCDGDAHSNAYIDNCGRCLSAGWGRMMKAEAA